MDFFQNNKFFRFGLPLVLLSVAGSFGIRELAQLRIEVREEKSRQMSMQEIENLTKMKRKPFSIDDEFKRLNEKIDINSYENKRIPRPGESTKDL
eukprot:m.391377 g.391377  ORF g.391377 m.391377 type:complete len:95 (-) comp21074_c0_seq14:498-782(-)